MCILPLDLSSCYPEKQDKKSQNYKNFDVRMYDCKDEAVFNSLVVYHFELLLSTGKLQQQ